MPSSTNRDKFLYLDDTFHNKSNIIFKITAKRIVTKKNVIELKEKSIESKTLFKSLSCALVTDWFHGLSDRSQTIYINLLSTFISWLNTTEIIKCNRLSIIKDFETYRVNVDKNKPQSTGANLVIRLISESLNNENINNEEQAYLQALSNSTKLSLHDEKIPTTLTNFFSSIHWLKQYIPKESYYKLESPKRLMESFSITIASTLLYILDIKKNIAFESLNNISEHAFKSLRTNNDHWCREIFSIYLDLKDSKENKILKNLIIQDIIHKNIITDLEQWIKENRYKTKIPFRMKKDGKYISIFKNPNIFIKGCINKPGEIEEILFSWLCAWQAIQPSDINELKLGDYALHKNNNNRVVTLQCSYYKSRAKVNHEPPPINSNSIEGKAILNYLELFKNEDDKLLSKKLRTSMHFTFETQTSVPAVLKTLWESKDLSSIININLSRRKTDDIFKKSYLSIVHNSGPSHSSWEHHQRSRNLPSNIECYKKLVKNPLPQLHFHLSSIKNSSVHSRTDAYRDGDLVNFNSHSSETEKCSYLTDANKEWVNQYGRITRLVIKDLENYSYKPNLYKSISLAQDKSMRTRLIKDHKPNPIKIHIDSGNTSFDEVIVLETTETVINMLHYIQQVEEKYSSLINHSLEYFEKTVLPTVEWMHYVIHQMMPQPIVLQGSKDYDQIKNILPPLFTPQLAGGIL